MVDLDQGGSFAQQLKVYMGPTIGWVMFQVNPELDVTSAAALVIQPFTSRVLLKAAVTSITLPDVSAWMKAPFQQYTSGFDRSLWIKDFSGSAQANNITITGFNAGAQKIDGLSSFKIISNHALLRLYPLNDLSGWYSG